MFGLVIRRNNNIRVFLQKRFIKDVHHWLFLQNVILKKKHSDVSGGSSAMKSLGCFYCRLSIEIHSSVSMVYLGCIHYKNTQMFFCQAFTWLDNLKNTGMFLYHVSYSYPIDRNIRMFLYQSFYHHDHQKKSNIFYGQIY